MDRRDFLKTGLLSAIAVSAIGKTAGAAEKAAIAPKGNNNMHFDLAEYGIIDSHMHPYLASDRNFPFEIPKSYEELFAEQRRAGIQVSCGAFNIFNDGSDFEVIRQCNRKVLEVHKKYPKLYLPGANIHPFFPEESCAEVQKFYDMGFRWVGEIASYVMNYREYACKGMFPILELMQSLGMTLNIHPYSVEDTCNLAKNFPRLKIVVAHPDNGGVMANYQAAEKYSNIYFDLSGRGLFRWGMLKKGVEMLGPDRLLFGTDFPVINAGMHTAGVLFEHISEKDRKMVFRENFLNLTGYKL
ncbi:MAG: amidohydrolase [Lentisphaeria bacterium]|nr:amidohydrolase [Lentisphaeria bacterium]